MLQLTLALLARPKTAISPLNQDCDWMGGRHFWIAA